MMNDISKEFRKYWKHCQSLEDIIEDTQNNFQEINNSLQLVREVKEELMNTGIERLSQKLKRTPTILVFGQNCHGKACFANILLGQTILPFFSSQWRHVSFIYGHSKNIRLTLHHEIEIVEKLQDHEKCWNIIPEVDLQRRLDESLVDHCPSLEVELPHDVLKENVCLMIPPDCPMDQLIEILHKHVQNVLPIVVYTISEGILTDSNIQEIRKLKDTFKVPFLFVAITPNETEISETESLTESEQHFLERGGGKKYTNLQQIRDELMSLDLQYEEGISTFLLH